MPKQRPQRVERVKAQRRDEEMKVSETTRTPDAAAARLLSESWSSYGEIYERVVDGKDDAWFTLADHLTADGCVLAEFYRESKQALDSAPALLEACEKVAAWRGAFDGSSLETWENVAQQFYDETGMLRPGKDVASGYGHDDRSAREEAFAAWCRKKNAEIDDMLRTAIAQAIGRQS